jgi:hypothetical protein
MVVIGQYPYQHTVTLELLHSCTGELRYYDVDSDRIRKREDIGEDMVIDSKYYIAYSKKTECMIDAYRQQIVPPPCPTNIKTKYDEEIKKVTDSAICLIVNDQSSELMEGIGASWNHHLGTWIVDSNHIKAIRDRRVKKHDGKVYKSPYVDGCFKVYGDVGKHIDKLQSIGAVYNEENDIWIVKAKDMYKIAYIWSS